MPDSGSPSPQSNDGKVIALGRRQHFQAEALFDVGISAGGAEAAPRPGFRQFNLRWPAYDRFRPDRHTGNLATVGLLQYGPQERSAPANVAYIVDSLHDVRDSTIVLPEFFLGSYSRYACDDWRQDSIAKLVGPLQELTASNRLTIVGSLPVHRSNSAANNAVVVSAGETCFSAQDKGRLFGREKDDFVPGGDHSTKLTVVGGLPASVQICMDIVDPLPARRSVSQGARFILGPSTVSVDFLRTIHKARALENQVVSVFCNRLGQDVDGIVYLGKSAIFFPDGAELAAPVAAEQLLLATVDLDYLPGYQQKFGAGKHPLADCL